MLVQTCQLKMKLINQGGKLCLYEKEVGTTPPIVRIEHKPTEHTKNVGITRGKWSHICYNALNFSLSELSATQAMLKLNPFRK